MQYYTTGCSYIVLGEFEKARQLFFKLRHFGRKFNRLQDMVESNVFLAIISWASNEKNQAIEALELALLAMQDHDFIRLVANEGAAILPVIKIIAGKVAHKDYQGPLNPVHVNRVYLATNDVSKQHKGVLAHWNPKTIKLSKKQQEILDYFAKGHNRDDIADQMNISLNTVKTHIKQLYIKLNVNNKEDAVTKALKLGLI
jgi:LuxR family maltose regulon positive regulatory protein